MMASYRLKLATAFLIGAMGAGCSWPLFKADVPDRLARQITASDQCGIGSGGLTYVNNEDGLSKFAGQPMQNLSMKALKDLSFDREHILIVGMGQKPTGGYGLTLANSKIVDDTLKLNVINRRPPDDAMVTQALTTPCVVLAISPDHWRSLEVNGNGMDTLRLEP